MSIGGERLAAVREIGGSGSGSTLRIVFKDTTKYPQHLSAVSYKKHFNLAVLGFGIAKYYALSGCFS